MPPVPELTIDGEGSGPFHCTTMSERDVGLVGQTPADLLTVSVVPAGRSASVTNPPLCAAQTRPDPFHDRTWPEVGLLVIDSFCSVMVSSVISDAVIESGALFHLAVVPL